MMFLPAGRFFTIPLPPLPAAARLWAAVMRPPLLDFAIHINLVVLLLFHEGYISPVLVDFCVRVCSTRLPDAYLPRRLLFGLLVVVVVSLLSCPSFSPW